MKKLWQSKSTGKPKELDRLLESFTVGDDPKLDMVLLPYDVQASKVHAEALGKIGILDAGEVKAIHTELDGILKTREKGEFRITAEQEDVHTAIEQWLTEKLGETGKKIHAGRSRNDQVLTALRLYEKAEAEKVFALIRELGLEFAGFAEKYEWVPMPGYTHTRKAMLSSVGMWAAGFAELLLMDLNEMEGVYRNILLCPLGTAAGFGTAFPIDRAWEAKELGFSRPVQIASTTQNSRGKVELQLVSAFAQISLVLQQLAADLILFTTAELDFFNLPDSFTTGSSIMPQKRNPDVAEILRGSHSKIIGYQAQLNSMCTGLVSGYHRDLQLTKAPVMGATRTISEMLEISKALVTHLSPNEEKLKKACTAELFAADLANKKVIEGKPFREAYSEAKKEMDTINPPELKQALKSKTQLGATGGLKLKQLKERISSRAL